MTIDLLLNVLTILQYKVYYRVLHSVLQGGQKVLSPYVAALPPVINNRTL